VHTPRPGAAQPDRRSAGPSVLVIARLFADEYRQRTGSTLAEDRLRRVEPLDLAGRGGRSGGGGAMRDAVLAADPVEQHLDRLGAEPPGEALAVVGQDLIADALGSVGGSPMSPARSWAPPPTRCSAPRGRALGHPAYSGSPGSRPMRPGWRTCGSDAAARSRDLLGSGRRARTQAPGVGGGLASVAAHSPSRHSRHRQPVSWRAVRDVRCSSVSTRMSHQQEDVSAPQRKPRPHRAHCLDVQASVAWAVSGPRPGSWVMPQA